MDRLAAILARLVVFPEPHGPTNASTCWCDPSRQIGGAACTKSRIHPSSSERRVQTSCITVDFDVWRAASIHWPAIPASIPASISSWRTCRNTPSEGLNSIESRFSTEDERDWSGRVSFSTPIFSFELASTAGVLSAWTNDWESSRGASDSVTSESELADNGSQVVELAVTSIRERPNIP